MSVSTRLHKLSNRLPKYQPLPWHAYLKHVFAKDAVLWIALALAAISSIIARPALSDIAGSIDAKTLACLAGLMIASGGFMVTGVFDFAAARLANRCRSARGLMTAMVFTTFFSSMLITNDVALIVFVPMTLIAAKRGRIDPTLTVVLQTVAANVGSILLPMGNPQNLYLYSRYNMEYTPFLKAVLPLSVTGALALAAFCFFAKKRPVTWVAADEPRIRARDAALYAGLFIVAALSVFDVMDWRISLAVAVVAMLSKGRILVQQVDYALLLTFVGFFVFVGNLSHMPAAVDMLRDFVGLGTFWAAVAASQVISNVPAAVLLSGFTEDAPALLAGVSAGGCGTLIASMASLISYKLHVRAGGDRRRFFLVFTAINILFLALMSLAHLFRGIPFSS